ncbi:MAG TPA: hypothetical protein VE078_11045 [Thermoanaerobaculia bacterium]|nr:hypothetical protein [Thermoanaerobaculia bacterium]
METRDFEHIRFVTQRFHDLQGLRYLVPLGLLLWSGAGAAYFTGSPLWLAVPFLGAFLLMLGARRYYRSAFGEVERPGDQPVAELYPLSIFSAVGPAPRLDPLTPGARLGLILGLAPAFFLLFQFLFWPPWIGMDSEVIMDPTWDLSAFSSASVKAFATRIAYPLLGSFFVGVWLSRGRRLFQSHHLGIGLLLSGLFILGLAAQLWVTLLLCGSAMIVAGLLDHWQLVRNLSPREEK